MRTLKVNLGERSYPVFIGSGVFRKLGEILATYKAHCRFAIITNTLVDALYGRTVERVLRDNKFKTDKFVVADGERFKTLMTTDRIVGEMLRRHCDRKTVIIALGGGVTLDLAGFVAASFMRGVDFISLPTTLLAQVDASLGGKVGVNHRLGKNMIGAFYQPKIVGIDPGVLKTLPAREIVCGLAEIIKHAVILDRNYFEMIEQRLEALLELQPAVLEEAIFHSCEIKARIISEDEREHGLRTILNFGHTIGHALETATGYRRFRHGEAVILGMLAEAYISWKSGRLSEPELRRFERLLSRIPLNVRLAGIDKEKIMSAIYRDKKATAGRLLMILPTALGGCEATLDFRHELIPAAIDYSLDCFRQWNKL